MSYAGIFWCGMTGSNRRPQTCKDCALPTELIPHGPAYACGWHQIHDVLRREPVNGRAHIESNSGFGVVLHLMQGQPNLWSERWDSNPLTQRERIYSPPRLSNFAALRNYLIIGRCPVLRRPGLCLCILPRGVFSNPYFRCWWAERGSNPRYHD